MKTATIDSYILPHLANVNTYDPAEPLEAMAKRAGMPAEQIVRLNANENAYGPSPKVAEALANLQPHIYPDPLQLKLREKIGEYVGADPARVIAGAGSDELIDLLFRLVVAKGDTVIDSDPTFGMYGFCARIAGAEIRTVPRDESFDMDTSAVIDAIDSTTKMIMLAMPNNPTGNLATESQIRALLDTGLLVVVDEAYYEFCGVTFSGMVTEHENLIVLRTFSKWAGLAGLRVGYGVMSPSLVDHIIDIKSPFNVNSAGEAAALASIDDAEYQLEKVKRIVDERERIFPLLQGMAGVTPVPSGGNYILCGFGPGRAEVIFEGMAKRGIFLRKYSHPRLVDHFRITVGTPEQDDAVLGALAEVV